MNKERLDWIMSGLNKYALTKYEDHFLKATLEDFDKKNALTEQQEERLERLYKEKSQLISSKKTDRFSFKESTPKNPASETSPKRVTMCRLLSNHHSGNPYDRAFSNCSVAF